jgi:hypothetical protein
MLEELLVLFYVNAHHLCIIKIKNALFLGLFILMVGTIGFEPMTSCSQSKRATKLRNVPKQRV